MAQDVWRIVVPSHHIAMEWLGSSLSPLDAESSSGLYGYGFRRPNRASFLVSSSTCPAFLQLWLQQQQQQQQQQQKIPGDPSSFVSSLLCWQSFKAQVWTQVHLWSLVHAGESKNAVVYHIYKHHPSTNKIYWVLALTRGALPNLVASCVPAGFPHVFDDFWYFWMWGDVLKVCVPAVFGEGWRCWRLGHMASDRHQSLCGRLWNGYIYIFQRKFRSQTSENLKDEKQRREE